MTVMKTSVALVTSSSPSLEMFPTAGSSRTALRTLARGSTRLVGPPGADAAELCFVFGAQKKQGGVSCGSLALIVQLKKASSVSSR